MIKTICGLVFVAAMAASSALSADDSKLFNEPKILSSEGFNQVFAQLGPNLYIAGQPSPDGLARVKELGVTTVINLRTSREMDSRDVVPFDEAAKIAELDMQYVHIPLGGPDTPYSPAAVEEFAAKLDLEKPPLLHCTVAWRATHLWMAYLVNHQNVALKDAVEVGKQLNLGPIPLEGFLGQELTLERQ